MIDDKYLISNKILLKITFKIKKAKWDIYWLSKPVTLA